MDQSVLNAIKMRYKRKLMLKLILEDEHLPFSHRLKQISLSQCMDWLASSWEEISPSTIKNSWNKLIDEFPGYEYHEQAVPVQDNIQDIKLLIAAADKVAGTETSEADINRWLNDQVIDSDGNNLGITSYPYTDEEIVKEVLHQTDDVTYTDEEWLDISGESVEEVEEQTIDQPAKDNFLNCTQNFSHVLSSLNHVIDYVKDDLSEVTKLVALRNKLINAEWKKRNQ